MDPFPFFLELMELVVVKTCPECAGAVQKCQTWRVELNNSPEIGVESNISIWPLFLACFP